MGREQFQSCIDLCNACADACDECAFTCLGETNAHALSRCIGLNVDCAAMCRLAAAFMARGSAAIDMACDGCARLCDMCGEECERHPLVSHCRQCAEACHRCADECRRVAMGMQAGRRGTMAGAPLHH